MRQSNIPQVLRPIALLFALLAGACDKGGGIGATSTGKIVCLTPAGTNLLVAMGLAGRVVGVSGYEADPKLKLLPKVGDYERIDWERFFSLKPNVLIVQGRRDRLPPGVRERCEDNGIAVCILQIDRLDDIYAAATQLGKALQAEPAAAKLVAEMKDKLHSLPQLNQPIPALIVLNDSGTSVVGTDNYLDDLLYAAGGSNVITTPGFATIDAEKLRSLKPDRVFLMMPGATPAMIDAAKKNMDLPAVREGHLRVISDDNALLPGANVVNIAQQFADGWRNQ